MRKSLFEGIIEYSEKVCEKLSLYSGLYSFYLVLLFLILLLNCIPYGTEAYLGLPQNLRWSSFSQKLMTTSWQFSTYFNFHVYFFQIFKYFSILNWTTTTKYTMYAYTIYGVFAEHLFWRIPLGVCFLCSKPLDQVLETSLLWNFKEFISGKNHKLKISVLLPNFI